MISHEEIGYDDNVGFRKGLDILSIILGTFYYMNKIRFPPDYECHFVPILPRIRELIEPFREKYYRSHVHNDSSIGLRAEEDASKEASKQI